MKPLNRSSRRNWQKPVRQQAADVGMDVVEYLIHTLNQAGSMAGASEALGVSRQRINALLAQHGYGLATRTVYFAIPLYPGVEEDATS